MKTSNKSLAITLPIAGSLRPERLCNLQGHLVMKLIPLSGILGKNKFAIVDDDDYDFLIEWSWHCKSNKTVNYAYRTARINGKCVCIPMHRQIMKIDKLSAMETNILVDHIDNNGLNNQKSNLRICNHLQNGAHRNPNKNSIHRGVRFRNDRNKWTAQIRFNYKNHHLGEFDTQHEAVIAYNNAAKKFFGEFAILNQLLNPNP